MEIGYYTSYVSLGLETIAAANPFLLMAMADSAQDAGNLNFINY